MVQVGNALGTGHCVSIWPEAISHEEDEMSREAWWAAFEQLDV